MKGQLDYKLPKKMKKRRQLDALVDTVKLPRTRKNSASVQELLDSDSSENDEFSLPPQSSRRKNRCCVWQSIAAQIGLFMVTTACLTTCVGLVWVQWHIRQELDSLRKQVASVENSDKAAGEMLKFQSQLAEVNASLMNVKTGHGSLQELTNIVTAIQDKLKELEKANSELQASVSASKELLNVPKKLGVLSDTLASLGSDINRLDKDAQTLKNANLESRIAALETAVREKNASSSSSVDKPVSQEVINFNESLNSGLQSLRQGLEQQSTRIQVLEEFTKSLSESSKSGQNNSWVTELVNKLFQEKMPNLTAGDQSVTNASQTLPGVIPVEKGEFLAFKADILGNFEHINKTVIFLNDELDAVAARLEGHDKALVNLTTAVRVIKNKDKQGSDNPEVTTTPTSSSTTGSPVTTPPTSSHVESITEGNETTRAIHIDGINSWEDLHKAFTESWPLDKGQLDINVVNDLLNTEVDKDDLKKFDTDGNDLFSEDEMATALGFHHNPRFIFKQVTF